MTTDGTTPLQALCDGELFMRFVAGDDSAYTALYDRYNARLLSYLHSILGVDNRAAEDIFQETFLRLFRERAHYREHGGEAIRNIGGWLFRVGRNLALNQIRSMRYLTELPPSHDERLLVPIEEAYSSVFADGPDEETLMNAVHSVVEQLPAGLREAFVLREVNGMSYEETAEIIGCSAEAARMRLSRARSAIRAALQSLFISDGE
jgi:RNA polymerase sigma-70 factor (ECF subfamily)